jgi:hypothetical protein
MMDEDQIRLAFLKVKEDVTSLQNEIASLKSELASVVNTLHTLKKSDRFCVFDT